MRVVVQRVSNASVKVNDETIAAIKRGLLLLIGFAHDDTNDSLKWMARKVVNLRIFEDEAGKMNFGVAMINGELLAVSQFTLYANAQKGNRPSFTDAAQPEQATLLFDSFCDLLEEKLGKSIQRGKFGAHMEVNLTNNGPVTIILESPKHS